MRDALSGVVPAAPRAVHNRVFGTRPIVIHAHGPLERKPHWPRIRDAFFAQPPRRVGAPSELTVLTCNNGAHAMGLLERSAAQLGVPVLVCGQEFSPWVNAIHKPRAIAAALEDVRTEFVLYADSRDAIFVRPPRLALESFTREFDCDLLFGGDRINWPALPRFRRFERGLPGAMDTEFRYLNGGAWIGRTAFCREFFREARATAPLVEAPDSEQGILKTLFMRHYPRVQLDYRCRVFQNIGLLLVDIFEIVPDDE